MAKDDKYILYGDDNRVEQEQLEDLAAETDDLLANNSRRRKKQQSKNTVPNVLDDINDLDFSDSTDMDSTQEMPQITEEEPANDQKTPDSTTPPAQPNDNTPEEPKKNSMVVPIVILVVVILVMLLVIFALVGKSQDRRGTADSDTELAIVPTQETVSTPEPTTETTETPEVTTESSSDAVGYMSTVDRSHRYTVGETLKYAENINSAALSYLNSLTKAVANNTDSSSASLHDQLDEKQKMLNSDIDTLKSYETMFSSYSGAKYISSCEARFNNIKDMYAAALQEYPTSTDRINAVNALINKENGLAENSKTNLKNYLDVNKIQYTEENNELKYSY